MIPKTALLLAVGLLITLPAVARDAAPPRATLVEDAFVSSVLRDNRIGPGNARGVVIESDIPLAVTGNDVLGNHFIDLAPELRVVEPGGNRVEGNTWAP